MSSILDQSDLNLKDYKQIDRVFDGYYSEIYLYEEKKSGKKVAIKICKQEIAKEMEKSFTNEIHKFHNLINPAILLLSHFLLSNVNNKIFRPIIQTDFMENGSLKDIFELNGKQTPQIWNDTKKYIIFIGIALGMKCIHDNKNIHGNLDPSHVLLDENYYPKIKCINFSQFTQKEEEFSIYKSPEVYCNSEFYQESDVYSFAFIAYQLFTGLSPNIKSKTQYQKMENIRKGKRPDTTMINDQQLTTFLDKCWASDPLKRCTFERIVDDVLRGKCQSAFPNFDESEVTNYIKFFTSKDESLKDRILPVNCTFENVATDDKFKLKIFGYQTVSDVIEMIKQSKKYDFNFQLFTSQKLENENYLVDHINDKSKVINIVRLDENNAKQTSPRKQATLSEKVDSKTRSPKRHKKTSAVPDESPKEKSNKTDKSDETRNKSPVRQRKIQNDNDDTKEDETEKSKKLDVSGQKIAARNKSPVRQKKKPTAANDNLKDENETDKSKKTEKTNKEENARNRSPARKRKPNDDLKEDETEKSKKLDESDLKINSKESNQEGQKKTSTVNDDANEDKSKLIDKSDVETRNKSPERKKKAPTANENIKEEEEAEKSKKSDDPDQKTNTKDSSNPENQKKTSNANDDVKEEAETDKSKKTDKSNKEINTRNKSPERQKKKSTVNDDLKEDQTGKSSKESNTRNRSPGRKKKTSTVNNDLKENEQDKSKKSDDPEQKINEKDSNQESQKKTSIINDEEDETNKSKKTEKSNKEINARNKSPERQKKTSNSTDEQPKDAKENGDLNQSPQKNITKKYNLKVMVANSNISEFQDFEFPINFIISDAIKQIEESENKYRVKIYKKTGKDLNMTNNDENIYQTYYNDTKTKLIVAKYDIKYRFAIENSQYKYEQKFNFNDKLIQIASYLVYKQSKNTLEFTETPSENFEYAEKLVFIYKGKQYSSQDTFYSLHYNYREDDRIIISLSDPVKIDQNNSSSNDTNQSDNNNNENNLSDNLNANNQNSNNDDSNANNSILKTKDDIQIPIDRKEIFEKITYYDDMLSKFLPSIKIGFKFTLKSKAIPNYYINLDDDNESIDEIKAMLIAHIEKNPKEIFSPKKIILKYHDKEIKENIFKDIHYKEGEFINVSIRMKKFTVQIDDDDECKTYDLEESHLTVNDLQRAISTLIPYRLFFKDKELKGNQNLKDLHISDQDIIEAQIIDGRILFYNGNIFDLDPFDLFDDIGLRRNLTHKLGIDVENSNFIYGNTSIKYRQFYDLPDISRIEVVPKEIDPKFNNFLDPKYNNLFSRDEEIRDVRKFIIEKRGFYGIPIGFKAGGMFLSNKTKLFQAIGQISVEEMDDQYYSKRIYIPHHQPIQKYFSINATGAELRRYVTEIIINQKFLLLNRGEEIQDFDKLCEFGEDIEVKLLPTEENDSNNSNESIIFIFILSNNENIEEKAFYSEKKKLFLYKRNLELDDKYQYYFFAHGKLIFDDKDDFSILKDVKDRKVFVYKQKPPTFDISQRIRKTQPQIETIYVENMDNSNEKISIKYGDSSDLKTILDLRIEVAFQLKIEVVDKISLFIKSDGDFALLMDKDFINKILDENVTNVIHYKILKGGIYLSPKMAKKYQEYASNMGVNLTINQIQEIYIKNDSDEDLFLSTIDYLSDHLT